MDNLSRKSAWNQKQLKEFLVSSKIPIRVSVLDGEYPLVCSVWFESLSISETTSFTSTALEVFAVSEVLVKTS